MLLFSFTPAPSDTCWGEIRRGERGEGRGERGGKIKEREGRGKEEGRRREGGGKEEGHTLILLATLVTVLEIFIVVQVLSSHTKEVDADVAVVWMWIANSATKHNTNSDLIFVA